ncbi:MAG: LysM domain-containing protein, partial [Clostridia bacterium]
ATLSGNILLEVTHRSAMPSRPLVITRHTVPFEETLSLMGENGDTLVCDAVVKDVAVLSQDGQEEGARTLRAEVLLGVSAHATRKRDVCLLLDAYTTQGNLLVPKRQQVMRALAHKQVHTAESGKLTLLLDGQPPARTPLRAALRPVITELSRAGGKLSVEGMMETTLLYMTDESDIPRSYQTEEPFRMNFTCDLSRPESLVLTPTNIEVTGITSDRVEVKFILHVCCYDVQLGDEPLVVGVDEQPADPVDSGILLCFSQPGETVWDIAKRYRVSCDSLKRMNPSLGTSEGSEKVILWRK